MSGVPMSALWGKSSWFGGPNDSTSGPTTASGAPTSTPGIAVYNRTTLGGWWLIKAPNGHIGIVKQTDIGPAPYTGRKFDYTYSLLSKFGYTQKNFPTGGQTFGYYLGKNISAPGFGTDLSNALAKLGATPSQTAGITQAVSYGSISQGKPADVQSPYEGPGTTNPSEGQSTSKGAKAEGLPGLFGGLFGKFLKELGIGGSADLLKRGLEIVGGLALLYLGLKQLASVAGVQTPSVPKVVPV